MTLKKIVALSIFILISQLANSQCAMCKAVVENGDHKIAEGINSGIIYLMIFPYLFLAIGIYFLYKRHKKKNNGI